MKSLLLSLLLASPSFCGDVNYKVQLTSNDAHRVVEVSADRYVAAVLAGESSTFHSDEALKAMAVAARTYAATFKGRHQAEGFDFCATTHCQRFDLQGVTDRLTSAVAATAGELLWYEGKPAFSVYTRDCGGKSESVQAVWPDVEAPYLLVHPDTYCGAHTAVGWTWSARPEDIVRALRTSDLKSPGLLVGVAILARTASGRAKTLQLEGGAAGVPISASSFRFAIGRCLGWNTLRSDAYEVQNLGDRIIFRGRGEGHGVGLCQNGADEMGIEGASYREILAFYYPGTTVSRIAGGLNWSRLGGEGVAVFTTHPEADRKILSSAEELTKNLEVRLRMTTAHEIGIRVYPDVETFRNATGEPGWVAARTSGWTIDLQPIAILESRGVLRQTLRHELLHVVIGAEAAPDLPVWFREGVVEWLTGAHDRSFSADLSTPGNLDDDLRQRKDRVRAERAYREATARVSALVGRYGEDVVLGWIKRGLPAEVRNSSVSSAATNNK